MDIGQNIKKIRTQLNLTQAQFAEKIFLSPHAVSKWENGNNTPSLDDIERIAETFHVSILEIMGIPMPLFVNPYYEMVLTKLYECQLIIGTEELKETLYRERGFPGLDEGDFRNGFLRNVSDALLELQGMGYLVRSRTEQYDVIQMTFVGLYKSRTCYHVNVTAEEPWFGKYMYDSIPAEGIYGKLIENIENSKLNPFLYEAEEQEFEVFHNKDRILELVFGIRRTPGWKSEEERLDRAKYWNQRKKQLLELARNFPAAVPLAENIGIDPETN